MFNWGLHLLVSPLNGAVSLVEVDDITILITWETQTRREAGEKTAEGGWKIILN